MHSITRGPGRILLLVVAALLVATAGSATAGGLITGKRIKDGSVTGVDLRDGSVGSVDVKNGTLTEADFDGSLVGQPGPAGPQGPQGDAGPQGPAGTTGLEYVTAPQAVRKGTTETWYVVCPPGKKSLGGGVSSTLPATVRITESAPLNDGAGWTVALYNSGTATVTGYAWSACVTV